ncbi:MAG TPA: DUF1330 domain-containing protein [Pseudonocardiaceae bacterium]|jgi:uncharacterized protein (DUF1330 family)|nr:DUF1330 domain-containing protein [Pseudonocardiaceae bacterium]
MAKAYWVVSYRAVHDPERIPAYGELATPAIQAGGGRILARGGQVVAHEAGLPLRTVVVEFDSFQAAVDTHDGDAYQKALAVLGDAVERDFRIVEGVD